LSYYPLGLAPYNSTFLVVTDIETQEIRPSTSDAHAYEWTIEPYKWHPFAHAPETAVITHGTAFQSTRLVGDLVTFHLRFDLIIGEETYDNLSELELLRFLEATIGRSPVRYRSFSQSDDNCIRSIFRHSAPGPNRL